VQAQIESTLEAGAGDNNAKKTDIVTTCEAEAARRAATTARVRDELNALERRVEELLRAATAATAAGASVFAVLAQMWRQCFSSHFACVFVSCAPCRVSSI
jgi:BMFP domain-containing protein YqiC